MVLDLNDPDSILAWWKVWPARHDGFLDFHLNTKPQFAFAIREAQRRIASDPGLGAMLAAGVWELRAQQEVRLRSDADIRAYQLKHREFAAAA